MYKHQASVRMADLRGMTRKAIAIVTIGAALAGAGFASTALAQAPAMPGGPVTISIVDVDEPDLKTFPRFTEALKEARQVELTPGDALYLPAMWWHDVRSLEDFGALINFWWRDGEPPLLTPLNALYHAVITVKDLPPNEKKAWRNMFDHYIFGDDGDPVEHLPESGRGLLGKRTPELVERVKKLLIKALS